MGFSRKPSMQYLEINTFPNAVVTCDTTIRDTELNPFPAIQYYGSLTYAFLDIIMPNTRSTAVNHVNGFTLQLKDSTATWRDACVVPSPSMWISAQNYLGDVYFCGSTNIKDYIQNNAVMYPRMYQHQADADTIYFYGIRNRLRLYFEV